MGKNLDTDSIFGSYLNKVLLKEAVKPTESTEPAAPLTTQERAYADSAKAQGKNWTDAQARLMFARQNQVKGQAPTTSTTPQGSTPSTPIQPVTNSVQPAQPATQKHEDDVKRFLGELPEETGDTETHSAKEIQDWMDTNSKEMETQNPGLKGNWVNTSGEPIDDSSEDMGEPTETTTQVIPNATQTTSIAAGDDEFEQNDEEENDDEGWSDGETTTQVIPNATQTTSIAAGDDENFHPYQKKIQKIAEKRNISKFLRHLSEKNYSSAHKYLKAILEQKVKTKVLEGINKI